jgi:hypothetical protein
MVDKRRKGALGKAQSEEVGVPVKDRYTSPMSPLKQFKNLELCEFEKAVRFPSGRRDCIPRNQPCGIENIDNCRLRKDILKSRKEIG